MLKQQCISTYLITLNRMQFKCTYISINRALPKYILKTTLAFVMIGNNVNNEMINEYTIKRM